MTKQYTNYQSNTSKHDGKTGKLNSDGKTEGKTICWKH